MFELPLNMSYKTWRACKAYYEEVWGVAQEDFVLPDAMVRVCYTHYKNACHGTATSNVNSLVFAAAAKRARRSRKRK